MYGPIKIPRCYYAYQNVLSPIPVATAKKARKALRQKYAEIRQMIALHRQRKAKAGNQYDIDRADDLLITAFQMHYHARCEMMRLRLTPVQLNAHLSPNAAKRAAGRKL